jgi:hypothetical protein
MSKEGPSLYDLAHLTPRKQEDYLEKYGRRWLYGKASDCDAEKLFQKLLGKDCPRLQRLLFECLCDGHLGWHSTPRGPTPIRWPPLTMWTDGLVPMNETEVIEVIYEVEWHPLNHQERRKFKTRLRRLEKELSDRLLRRHSLFRLVRFERDSLWLQEPIGMRREEKMLQAIKALKEPDSAEQPMSLDECKRFLRTALSSGRREVLTLQQECKALECRPGTFRRALKQLGAKRVRKVFGPTGKWYVYLP